MTKLTQGFIAGLVFGILDVLVMVPIPIPDKAIAMAASFFNRFAIGFFIATVDMSLPGWAKGLFIGLLLSLPDALITKMYVPVIGIGVIGGLIVGLLVK